MKDKLIMLLEVYRISTQQMENSINNGEVTAATEYRFSIEKKCYNTFIEQLELIIEGEKNDSIGNGES